MTETELIDRARGDSLREYGRGLADAVLGRIRVPLDPDYVPKSRAEAYAIQDGIADTIGVPQTGWKVGATSPAMREIDGHDDIIPGRLFKPSTWETDNFVAARSQFDNCLIEAEFAFRVSAELIERTYPWTRSDILGFATLHPAIEIIGPRLLAGPELEVSPTLLAIADNGGGIGCIIGTAATGWKELDLCDHPIDVVVDDSTEAENFLGANRAEPTDVLIELESHLRQRGLGLKAGHIVLTGAAVEPQPFPSRQARLDFGPLGRLEITVEGEE